VKLKTLAVALENALRHHDAALATGDLEAPTNPRRVRLL
jgi:hypothetical protein